MRFCYNSISQELLYICPAMQLHHQAVSCRTQALQYNVMSKCEWCYGELSVCTVYSIKMGTGSFPGVKCGCGMLLTPHPLLLPWSWKN